MVVNVTVQNNACLNCRFSVCFEWKLKYNFCDFFIVSYFFRFKLDTNSANLLWMRNLREGHRLCKSNSEYKKQR